FILVAFLFTPFEEEVYCLFRCKVKSVQKVAGDAKAVVVCTLALHRAGSTYQVLPCEPLLQWQFNVWSGDFSIYLLPSWFVCKPQPGGIVDGCGRHQFRSPSPHFSIGHAALGMNTAGADEQAAVASDVNLALNAVNHCAIHVPDFTVHGVTVDSVSA